MAAKDKMKKMAKKSRYFNENMGVRNEHTNVYKEGYEVADKGGHKLRKRK